MSQVRTARKDATNEEEFMKLIKPKAFNAGDKKIIKAEEPVEEISFNVFKNNNRPKPEDNRRVLIISCISEFGCEIVGCMYCLPRIMQQYPGHYKVAVGWYGREYLYRHLVDEFWEIKEEHMWLRDYSRAFHHDSKNLKRLEASLSDHGKAITSQDVGRVAVGNRCKSCNSFWGDTNYVTKCPYCKHEDVVRSLFGDIPYWKPQAVRIPQPSKEKKKQMSEYIGENPVGIFARGRTTYGRNLQPEFYKNLIALFEEMGYNPIWLGEKQSTQPCPVDHIRDFSRSEESRDLEKTLAIISQCKFTFQAYTASSRLASMVGVPYLLLESPDQIWGQGQEGFRRNLCDFTPRKLAVCHFLNLYENNDRAIELIEKCVKEMEAGDYTDVFDMLDTSYGAQVMKRDNESRVGG